MNVHITIKPPRHWLHRLAWYFRRKEYAVQLPGSWAEVPAEDILPVMKILMQRRSNRQACLLLLQHFLPLRHQLYFLIRPLDLVEKLIPAIRWMLTEPLTELPYKPPGYHLPAARLEGMPLQQYIDADRAYTRLMASEDGGIDDIVRILLRTERVGELPPELKFYLLYFFSSCKQYLYDTYRLAFEGDGKKEEELDWDDVLTDVAEAGTFGPLHLVQQVDVHTFFKWLVKNKRRHMKDKQRELQEIVRANHKKFLA